MITNLAAPLPVVKAWGEEGGYFKIRLIKGHETFYLMLHLSEVARSIFSPYWCTHQKEIKDEREAQEKFDKLVGALETLNEIYPGRTKPKS